MSGGASHSSLTCGNPPTTNPNVSETGRGHSGLMTDQFSLSHYGIIWGGGIKYTLQYNLIIQPFQPNVLYSP